MSVPLWIVLLSIAAALIGNVWWNWRKRTHLQIEYLEMRLEENDGAIPEFDLKLDGKKAKLERR